MEFRTDERGAPSVYPVFEARKLQIRRVKIQICNRRKGRNSAGTEPRKDADSGCQFNLICLPQPGNQADCFVRWLRAYWLIGGYLLSGADRVKLQFRNFRKTYGPAGRGGRAAAALGVFFVASFIGCVIYGHLSIYRIQATGSMKPDF